MVCVAALSRHSHLVARDGSSSLVSFEAGFATVQDLLPDRLDREGRSISRMPSSNVCLFCATYLPILSRGINSYGTCTVNGTTHLIFANSNETRLIITELFNNIL